MIQERKEQAGQYRAVCACMCVFSMEEGEGGKAAERGRKKVGGGDLYSKLVIFFFFQWLSTKHTLGKIRTYLIALEA